MHIFRLAWLPGLVKCSTYRAFEVEVDDQTADRVRRSEEEQMKVKLHIKKLFDKYVSVEERQLFIMNYLAVAKVLSVNVKLNDCRDPKDNQFLELALVGNAEIIVTGDEDLLVLHPYRAIQILNSSVFLDRLAQGGKR